MSWFGGKKKQKPKQYSGFPGDCSEEQLHVLAKFKKHVQLNKKLPTQQFDEVYLLRFLRARKFDLQKTIKMWDHFIDWRVKHSIDNFKKFKFPELPQLRKLYPHGYHKVDKHFRPIYIQRVGIMEVDKIFKVMEAQNMLQYYAMLYETLLTTIFDGCTKTRQQLTGQHNRVTQTITILDLKHVKLSNASKAYDFVKPVSAMAQDNYPQILGNMFIVNAPMLFTGIWAMVKMWIDDKTKQKIKILGSSYKKQLLEYIDPENLPTFLDGGKCKCNGQQCKLDMNVGPWNPQGKQMFYFNINNEVEQKPEEHKGYHKQQLLLSSPDVLIQVQVKNDAPFAVQRQNVQQQQDRVLKMVKQLDESKQKVEESTLSRKQENKVQISDSQPKQQKAPVQLEVLPHKNEQEKISAQHFVEQGTQTSNAEIKRQELVSEGQKQQKKEADQLKQVKNQQKKDEQERKEQQQQEQIASTVAFAVLQGAEMLLK